MIELLIVMAALIASVWYVWRYYARRPRARVRGDANDCDAAQDCRSGCTGCPPRD